MRSTRHTLIVNSVKRLPPELIGHDLVGDISLITEEPYSHGYNERVEPSVVRSVDDLDEVRRAAMRIAAKKPITAILAPAEHGVTQCGYLRTYLGLGQPGFDVASRFANKAVMKRSLTDYGIPHVPFRVCHAVEDLPRYGNEIGWPVVVKAAFGTGCAFVYQVSNADSMNRLVASAAGERLAAADCPLVVEQRVEIDVEYHCEAVVRHGHTEFFAASQYFDPLLRSISAMNGSYLLCEGQPEYTELAELHDRVVGTLGLRDGVTHFEAFAVGRRLLVSEIACRPGGGAIVPMIRRAFGVDLWQAFVEAGVGAPSTVSPRPPRGVYGNCHLPVARGRIVKITEAAQLRKMPLVVDVEMSYSVGDVIESRMHSSLTTGMVHFEGDSGAAIEAAARDVAKVFVCRVAPTTHSTADDHIA